MNFRTLIQVTLYLNFLHHSAQVERLDPQKLQFFSTAGHEVKLTCHAEAAHSDNKLSVHQTGMQSMQLTRNWSLLGLLSLFPLGAVLAFVYHKQSILRSRRHQIVLEQRLLRLQMNPHFIFNALQSIQDIVMRNNKEEAARYLGSFASVMRTVIENSRTERIPLKKEIQFLENYLQLQKIRFPGHFDFSVRIDNISDLENIMVPPMLVQPFVENAVEHGVRTAGSGGKIDLFYSLSGGSLMIDVTDNGLGIDSTKTDNHGHCSLATAITRERIAVINRSGTKKIGFKIGHTDPHHPSRKGVRVTFAIPVNMLY